MRSSLKVGRLHNQEKLMLPLESGDGGIKLMSLFKGHQAGKILSYLEKGQPFSSTQSFN